MHVTVGSTESKLPVKAEPGIVTVDAYDSDSEEEDNQEDEQEGNMGESHYVTALSVLFFLYSILHLNNRSRR